MGHITKDKPCPKCGSWEVFTRKFFCEGWPFMKHGQIEWIIHGKQSECKECEYNFCVIDIQDEDEKKKYQTK